METSRFTPLDFRTTAAVQFRLLEMFCSLMKVTMEDLGAEFLSGQLVTERAISSKSLNDQGMILTDNFKTFIQMTFPPVEASYLVMLLVRLSPLQSALHTNKVRSLIRDPYYFYEGDAYYPLNDHAIFNAVSFCEKVLGFISVDHKRNRTDFQLTY